MTDYTGKIKVYIYSSLFLTLICTLLYGAAYLLSFEPDIGYFKSTALLPVISGALTVASLGFIFSAFVTIPKGAIPASRVPYGHASRLAASGCALGFGLPPSDAAWAESRQFAAAHTLLPYSWRIATYFLPVALGTNPGWRGPCQLYPDFLGCYNNVRKYIPTNTWHKQPIKVSFMMATLVVMLFMLYELRYLLERVPRAF